MSREVLRVGLVGCGQIADAHLAEIQRLAGVQLAGVCDADRDLAHQAALRFSVPGRFESLEAMLGSERYSVVHVTTPPHAHAALSRLALEAGCHVYVEKPFTVDAQEAEQVLDLAAARGQLVCVGHDHLWDPAWRRLKQLVGEGAIGDIVHVESVLGYDLAGPFGAEILADAGHWANRLPGKFFQNSLSHALYKITDLIAAEDLEVDARWYPGGNAGAVPTELRATLYGRRATGSIVFTSLARPVQRSVTVLGTRSAVEVDLEGRTLREVQGAVARGPFVKLELPLRLALQGARNLARNTLAFGQYRLHYFEGMRGLMGAFYEAIREGGPAPIAPAEILRVTRLMDRIFEACASGRRTAE